MATGRIINSVICKDKKVAELSDDTSRLAFTWLLTFADREGKTFGDPAIVRSMLFPRRDDFSNAQMEKYIQEWATSGMIVWYEVEGDKYILFPNFKKNQPNLRTERESPSIIPDPPDTCRSIDGVSPEQLPVKLTEDKLNKEKEQIRQIVKLYEDVISPITQPVRDSISLAYDEYSFELIIEAINEFARQNKRSWAYAETIMRNCKREGRPVGKPKNEIEKPKKHWDETLKQEVEVIDA